MKKFIKYDIANIYILAFLEGVLVMSMELISTRLLTPIFGNTIYVLTSVLGVTMLSLLIGYFIGGVIVDKNKYMNYPIVFILIAIGFMLLFPITNSFFFNVIKKFNLVLGTIISTKILIAPPLILLGSTTPQLVQLLSENNKKAGTSSGNIYAISTLGGVLSTFISGLFLIPVFGVKKTILWTSVFCSIIPLLLLLVNNFKSKFLLFFGFLLTISTISLSLKIPNHFGSNSKLIYTSDGFLGKLDVLELPNKQRVLLNDGTSQSIVDTSLNISIMPYVHTLSTVASFIRPSKRNNVAIFGLAAGTLVTEMQNLNYQNIYAIDVDKRTYNIAKKFMNLSSKNLHFIVDDGRHFIANTNILFDAIIIDVSVSEQQPYHLYTKEAINEYKSKLTNGGLIIFNVIDLTDVDRSKIIKKLGDALTINGLSTYLLKDFYPTPDKMPNMMEAIAHERIIVATNDIYETKSNSLNEMNNCCKVNLFNQALKQNFLSIAFYKGSNSTEPFTDDCPEMEKLNYERVNILRTKFSQ